jgi:hypothetical protein
MDSVKVVKILLTFHYQLSLGLCSSNEEEKRYMSR